MAGSPLKRRVLSHLESKAQAAGDGATAMSIVLDRLADGATLVDIADEIGTALKVNVEPALLTRWIKSTPQGKADYLAARALGAHVLADQAKQIADDCDADRDSIAKAKMQIDIRTFLASKFDRQTFGNDAAQVNVQLNMGQLHLDALRARNVIVARPEVQQLEDGTPDVEQLEDGTPDVEQA